MHVGKRNKVALVIGREISLECLKAFALIQEFAEFEVFALDVELVATTCPRTMRANLFQQYPEMPGYMKSLESRLAGFDILFTFESSALASFQCVRAAVKYQKPCVVIVNETRPFFYHEFENIRAIQEDILVQADGFWATSAKAEERLLLEGVPAERIRKIEFGCDTELFNGDRNARLRFREHIGFSPEDKLITVRHEPAQGYDATNIISAFRMARQMDASFAQEARLLLYGPEQECRPLKYVAFDSKIGSQVSFLHQDVRPFFPDLLAATDLYVHQEANSSQCQESDSVVVLQALASGCLVEVLAGSLAEEIGGKHVRVLADTDYQSIAADWLASFRKVFSSQSAGTSAATNEQVAWVRSVHAIKVCSQKIVQELGAIVSDLGKKSFHLINAEEEIRSIRDQLIEHDPDLAALKIEDLLLRDSLAPQYRSEVLRLKADLLFARGSMDEAMEIYGESLNQCETNHQSLCGLGNIALHGHAHLEALRFYRKALATCATDAESLRGIGMVKIRLHEYDESIYFFEKCLEIRRDDRRALSGLLLSCVESFDTEASVSVLEGLMEQGFQDPRIRSTLGHIYIREGDHQKGAALLGGPDSSTKSSG